MFDAYTFEGAAGDIVSIRLANVFRYTGGFTFDLIDPEGEFLSILQSAVENLTLPASGTYTIRYAIDGQFENQPYSVFLLQLTLIAAGTPGVNATAQPETGQIASTTPTTQALLPTRTATSSSIPTPVPATPTTPITCPGTLTSRLTIGQNARVIPAQGANRVRSQPTTGSLEQGRIPPGGQFEVLEGPVCANSYAWWRVNYQGLQGRTAEADFETYWLEPLSTGAIARPTIPPNELYVGGQAVVFTEDEGLKLRTSG